MVEAITSKVNKVDNTSRQAILKSRFAEINDKQGVLGSIWNGVKEITNSGVSKSDCENILEKYNKGEISFDKALEYINNYDKKQNNATELEANIVTGIASIAFATCMATGPIGWGAALLFGAPVGALVKAGIKIFDRATNKVKNDEFDTKQITKDMISGAVTGAASAVSSGVGAGIKAGKLSLSVKNGAKCGVECGALAGATSYATNVAFDKDKHFNMNDFVKTTATSAFVSGTVGAAVGVGMYGLSNNIGQDVAKSLKQTIIDDSLSSSSRKILGHAERNMMSIA